MNARGKQDFEVGIVVTFLLSPPLLSNLSQHSVRCSCVPRSRPTARVRHAHAWREAFDLGVTRDRR